MSLDPKTWTCWEILHDGEGPRGRKVEILGVHTPRAAAQEAARYFEDLDQRDLAYGFDDMDGTHQWIEVEGVGVFRVDCFVRRDYVAASAPRLQPAEAAP